MQVKANGIWLEVEEHGDKDAVALVLVRGLGSQLIHWPDELIDGFVARGFRVITFDNRDIGLSQRCPTPWATGEAAAILAETRAGRLPRPAYTLSDKALDVVGLLDALGIAKAHVFGISMGGAVTQFLAIDHADRFLSATIVMSSARLRDLALAEVLVALPTDRATYVAEAMAGHRVWGSPGFPVSDDYLRDQAGRAWDRGAQADGVNRQVLATIAGPDRRALLPGVNLPCLIIHGSDDSLVPPEAGREVAELIPGAEYEEISGMGHVITPLLAPLIVDRVDRFITGTGDSLTSRAG